jgi:hypothetical protein
VTVTGRQIAAGLPALAWAVIALAVAVLAARGRLRRAAALVGVVVSAAALAVAIGAHADVGRGLAARAFGVPARSLNAPTNLWWLVALLGAAVAASAYAAVVVLGAQWQGMGTRYDAPGSPAPTPSPGGDPAVEAWDALDRGDDPTARHPTD